MSGSYRGIAVPKSTPEPIRQKLTAMIKAVNEDPAFLKKMEEGGFAPVDYAYGKSADDFLSSFAKDVTAAAKEAGMLK